MSDPATHSHPANAHAASGRPWWIVLWAVLLSSLYLPTLGTRFDFIDDGNLVYPAPPMSPGQRLQRVAERIQANYEHLGPFRPVLWIHWEAAADLLGGDAFRWRCLRLFWTTLAAGSLLWLLREFGIRPGAAVLTAALVMWNPFRNEIWTSLTLAEGVAMPYALFSLICAIRASGSRRPWLWDLAGFLCVLAALGCKNTFIALIPVQVFLRIAPQGRDLREGLRRHGWRAGLLASTVLVPIVHYLIFKLTWHPGQYRTTAPSWSYLGELIWAIKGAISLEFMGAGLLLAVVAVIMNARLQSQSAGEQGAAGSALLRGLQAPWLRHRAACVAGLLLLFLGMGVYLPIGAISGRYTMPAVWGADLLIAALLSTLMEVPVRSWKRLAQGAVLCGLAAVAIANVGRQQKFAARAELLWQTLECVERQAPRGACVAWVSGPELNVEEGIHFAWHLHARGRSDLVVRLCNQAGRPEHRTELPEVQASPFLVVTGTPDLPPEGTGPALQHFLARYSLNSRTYQCFLWRGAGALDGR